MFRGKHKGETALWLGGQPLLGFLGDMGRVVVEDHFDSGVRGVSGVEFLEQTDELPRAMAILDTGVNFAGEQVNPREQAQRAMTLVLMIARPARMRSRLRWQVRRGASDRLDTRLLVTGDDRDVRLDTFCRAQDRYFAITHRTSAIFCSKASSRRSR
jgi:hypothetical protein